MKINDKEYKVILISILIMVFMISIALIGIIFSLYGTPISQGIAPINNTGSTGYSPYTGNSTPNYEVNTQYDQNTTGYENTGDENTEEYIDKEHRQF